jgi:hypothetical protein
MVPEFSSVSVPARSARGELIAGADFPPSWSPSFLKALPLLGPFLECMMNFNRYETTLEQNAELIAADLETTDSPWSGKRVCGIDRTQ